MPHAAFIRSLVYSGVLGISMVSAAMASDSIFIAMHSFVRADTGVLRLDQIAAIQGGDRVVRSKIDGVTIHIEANPGEIERVTRDDVSSLIALQVPDAVGRLRWSDKVAYTLVHVNGRPLDTSALCARAQAALENWLRPRFSHFSVELASAPSLSTMAAAKNETAAIRPIAGPVSSRTAVWVDLSRPGDSMHRSFPIWFAVHAQATVPVAARDIDAGTKLTAADVTMASIDVAPLGARLPVSKRNVPDSIAVTPFREGDVLTRDRVRLASAVEAGDEVRVRVRVGTLTVEAHGLALQSGARGQHVHVRNTDSGGILAASVVGHDLVEVSP